MSERARESERVSAGRARGGGVDAARVREECVDDEADRADDR